MRIAEWLRSGEGRTMSQAAEQMKQRTKQFALRVIRLVTSLPKGKVADVLGHQLLKSGTSVGANYRAACRARSRKDFCSKLGIVEEESDESTFWMEIISDSGLMKESLVKELLKESREITAIVVSSITTARRHEKKKQDKK